MPPAKKNSSRKSSSNAAAAAATTNRRKSRATPPSEDVAEAEVSGLETSVPEEEANGHEDSNDQDNSDEDMEEENDDDEEMEDDDDDDDDEEMEEEKEEDDEMNHETNETPTSQKKKDMFLRSGKRKRRRSKETSGLTPPETLKKSTNKRARRSTAAAASTTTTTTAKKQKKQESSATTATSRSSKRQNRGTTMNGDSSATVDTNTKPAAAAASKGRSSQGEEPESPVAGATTGLDPRRISYSQAAAGVAAVSTATTTTRKQAPSTSKEEEEEEEAKQENDVEIDEDMILNRPRNDDQNAETRPPARRRSAGEYIAEFTEGVVAVVAGGNVFAAASSSRRTTTTTGTAAAEGTTTEQQQLEETVEKVVIGDTQEEAAEPIGQESVPSKLVRRLEPHATNIFRLTFMTILALSFWVVWPRLANIAELVVPLDKSLADPSEPASPTFEVETTIDTHDSIVAEDDDDDDDSEIVVVDPPSDVIDAWNSDFLKEWTQVNEANAQFDASNEKILDTYNEWISIVDKISGSIEKRQTDARDRLKQLNRFNSLLLRHNQGGKLSREEMARIQVSSMELVGTPVFLTSQVDLWEIPDIDDVCTTDVDDENDEDATISDDENSLEVDVNSDGAPKAVDLGQVKKRISDLSLRAKMTAEKLISGDVAKRTVRRWVEDRLSDGLYSDPFVARTLDELESVHTQLDDNSPSTSHVATSGGGLFASSMYRVESAIQELLEMDRADKTGQFDHAAVSNGASIVYGGKRGTSNSLVDDLPLGNRLLRHINLRSYGFGPEAALTPTYPSNTLGQCWSFRQLTLDEQLNEHDGFRMYEGEKSVQIPDDFKRGSLGTLAVRFAEPLYVSSFVIEYPTKKSSDEDQSSAVRSFRLVGYEDAEATTKAWNLGSYTYDMKANIGQGTYLQEFEVPTSHGGHDIPMIRSISLAIDSNMGGDYTCLYRFRVHGDYE
mmetsp:Transcript_5875/g.14441  ORF Transcript_5875/g.14441 Transcript_5875/m.14441 type:complete len:953 (-) Transcript_5875:188-3046(-)